MARVDKSLAEKIFEEKPPLSFIAARSAEDGDVKDIVLSSDGRHEAVMVPYRGFDSGCRVWLRERGAVRSASADR